MVQSFYYTLEILVFCFQNKKNNLPNENKGHKYLEEVGKAFPGFSVAEQWTE